MSAEKKSNSSVKRESSKTSNQKNTKTNTKPKTNIKQEQKPKTTTTAKTTTKPKVESKPVAKTTTKKPEEAKAKTTTSTTTKPKTTAKTVEQKASTVKKPEQSKETKTVEKTKKVEEPKKENKQKETKKSDKVIKSVVITVIILALIGLLVWVIINAKKEYKANSYLDTVLSSENYDEMINEFNKNMKKDEEPGYKDEYYYFNYAFNSHMFDDAASTVSQNPEENTTIPAQFKYIYGKTINNVIDEGKKLMEEKHFSLSDYVNYLNSLKKDPNLENLSNATLNN